MLYPVVSIIVESNRLKLAKCDVMTQNSSKYSKTNDNDIFVAGDFNGFVGQQSGIFYSVYEGLASGS